MRLSTHLRINAQEILAAWDAFAATLVQDGGMLDHATLRDHAGEILAAIADELDRPPAGANADTPKPANESAPEDLEAAAGTHADTRMVSGFAIDAMITEYRAFRTSVVRLWLAAGGGRDQPRDMEDLVRFHEAMDQAIAESVARYTDQTRKSTELFIGILGHDIRNPLGTISMSAQYLVRSGKLAASAAETIINSVVRINSVIEHVVDFTRVQSEGMMPIKPVPGDLASQFAKVLAETRVRYPRSLLRLESAGNFEGFWDEGRMGQLLSNLLTNALTHGAADEPITVRLWENSEDVAFSVHNLGTPIPPQEQKRIFMPLVRGLGHGQGERRESSGLGLGLFICQEIVRAHGGTLDLASSTAGGTSFTVRLPRSAPAVPAPRNVS
ncbi:sensor histidine kinase [Polaromonas eurypsychrophila]|uniref:histidine kinase n=1 Tax=Polaromonas eurypsychrophila TaxID=1614635 RepID=A0A916SFR7_9BURK|nr:sensor histidine kinase [Polaromonas eurypsychrophila]GGA98035.1 two-component sensor histidine kinase [Polaromonas eurypsychrophila]